MKSLKGEEGARGRDEDEFDFLRGFSPGERGGGKEDEWRQNTLRRPLAFSPACEEEDKECSRLPLFLFVPDDKQRGEDQKEEKEKV